MRKFMRNKSYITCSYYRQKSHGIDTYEYIYIYIYKRIYVPSASEKLAWMLKALSSKLANTNKPKKF